METIEEMCETEFFEGFKSSLRDETFGVSRQLITCSSKRTSSPATPIYSPGDYGSSSPGDNDSDYSMDQ